MDDASFHETFFGKGGKGKGKGFRHGKRSSGKGKGRTHNPYGRDGKRMKCYITNPNTGQPCGSEEHLAKDCPYNTQNRSTGTSTNLATDMRTPPQATPSWGPEYATSANEPMYIIVVEGSDSSDDDNEGPSDD